MKERRAVTPYIFSADDGINASLSIAKIYGRARATAPGFKPSPRYRARLRSRLAAGRRRLATARP